MKISFIISVLLSLKIIFLPLTVWAGTGCNLVPTLHPSHTAAQCYERTISSCMKSCELPYQQRLGRCKSRAKSYCRSRVKRNVQPGSSTLGVQKPTKAPGRSGILQIPDIKGESR